MYRVNHARKRWRKKWPMRKWFPPVLDERHCKKCRLPFQNGPQPRVLQQFASGNVGGFLYPAGGWKRNQFALQVGRWKTIGKEFQLSGYISEDDLRDVAEVAAQAHRFIVRCRRKSRRQ